MADVKIDKQTSSGQSGSSSQDLERSGRERGLSRRGGFVPSLFSMHPREFFNMDPFTLMRRMQDDMDRAFGHSRAWGEGEWGNWSPAIEVSERDGKLRVTAELPGLKQDDVKVEATEEGLIIQGERKREHEESGKGFHRSERSYGTFYRSIPLPEGAQIEQASAQFNNGVLEVTVPVPEQKSNRRQIPIQGASAERKEVGSQAGAGQQKTKAAG